MERKVTFGLLLTILMSSLLSCSPANSKNDSSPSSGTPAAPPAMGTTRSTTSQKFLVHMMNTREGGTAAVGDNSYLVRVFSASDLSPISGAGTVSAKYMMMSMADMGETDAGVSRQADGSFLVSTYFSMPGMWHITLTIRDGNTQDDYVLEDNAK